jgi:hypothetical protein
MDVLLDILNVLADHVSLGKGDGSLLAELSSASHDFLLILQLVELRDISSVEDTVHIFSHGLLNDLSISEQEDSLLVLSSSTKETSLKVISPVLHGVAFNNLNLVDLEGVNAHSKSAERLSSGTTDSE